jgi:Flp pilus assembly CpaF family ATPase
MYKIPLFPDLQEFKPRADKSNYLDRALVFRKQIFQLIEIYLNPANLEKEAQDLQKAMQIGLEEISHTNIIEIFKSKFQKSLVLENFIDRVLENHSFYNLNFISPPSTQDKNWVKQILIYDFLFYGPVTILFLEPILEIIDKDYHQKPLSVMLKNLISNKRILEIRVNNFEDIFYETANQILSWPVPFISNAHLKIVIERIISETNSLTNASIKLNSASPIADFEHICSFVRGSAIVPPAVEEPILTLRIHPECSFGLEELKNFGMLDQDIEMFLRAVQCAGMTVAIAGTMGSGKTTLLSALAELWPKDGRKATIEDTPELKPKIEDLIKLRTIDYQRNEINNIDVTRLTKACKRHSVRYVVLSEARDGSAWEILQLSQAILGCLMTFHYTLRSDRYLVDQALNTLTALAKQHPTAPKGNDLKHLIADMVQILILVEQSPLDNLRRIKKIYFVNGYDEFNGGHFKALELFSYEGSEGFKLINISAELEDYLRLKGVDFKFLHD